MRIYGAGLAGLLTANLLRRHKPLVCEAQPSLPNNHDALLRFRTDSVSKATGIPFKKVTVTKAICVDGRLVEPSLKLSNWYSLKVTGKVLGRSIMNLEPVERWIAPPNLIAQLADGLDIRYNTPLSYPLAPQTHEPVVSTIPMPFLMKLADWPSSPNFNYQTITSITADLLSPEIDVYQTIYYPEKGGIYRASITGSHVILEIMGEMPNGEGMKASDNEFMESVVDTQLRKAMASFGVTNCEFQNQKYKIQRFGKIAPIAEVVRKEFILAMTDMYNVYSIGRYATWRQILLDDVVQDIQIIERFMTQRDGYKHKLATHK